MRPLRWLGWLLLVVPLVAILAERWIVTDGEAVEATIEALVEAAERGDFAAVEEWLDEEYDRDGRDRAAAARYAEEAWRRHRPQSLRVDVEGVVVRDDQAEATARLRGRGFHGVTVVVAMRLVRRPTGWRVTAAWVTDVGPGR